MEGFGRDNSGRCVPIDVGGPIQSVTIGPLDARTNDSLISHVVIDGERVDTGLPFGDYPVRYRWFVNGVESTGTADHLHGWKYFEKGDAVSLVVEPLDEEGAGTPSNQGSKKVHVHRYLEGVSLCPNQGRVRGVR